MDKSEQIKQKYADAATLSSKSLADGDSRTAHRQAKIVERILKRMENESVDKNILVELLSHEYIGVSANAVADLLRLGYETKRAEETLERIASMDDTDKGVDSRLRGNDIERAGTGALPLPRPTMTVQRNAAGGLGVSPSCKLSAHSSRGVGARGLKTEFLDRPKHWHNVHALSRLATGAALFYYC